MTTTTIPKKVEEEEEEVRFSILSSILFSFCVSLSRFFWSTILKMIHAKRVKRSPACSRVGETKREREKKKKEIKRRRNKIAVVRRVLFFAVARSFFPSTR